MSRRETKREFMARVQGQYVGAFGTGDLRRFEQLVREGRMVRSYEGVGGFMGLATARPSHPTPSLSPSDDKC